MIWDLNISTYLIQSTQQFDYNVLVKCYNESKLIIRWLNDEKNPSVDLAAE